MGKRPTSKEITQQVKRVNSKEDILKLVVVNDENKVNCDSSSSSSVSHVRVFSPSELENILKTSSQIHEKVVPALKLAHCSESLNCLLDIFVWEEGDNEEIKEETQKRIISTFVKIGSSQEICLPDILRTQLLEGTVSITEMKRHVVNDLRFNHVLLTALTEVC